jgi:hypothetical protein
MYKITSLYPQYQQNEDRRQQNIPVAVERRSGKDRRSPERVTLDKQLTKDLFEVKSQVAKLENFAPSLFSNRITTQTPTFASKNNFTQDQLVKETKPDLSAIARQEAKLKDKADTTFKIGVITSALTAAFAISFMGTTGAVIAIGTTIYIGGRILKTLVANETKESKKADKKNNY